jgi:indole-3-glycerol phosphate synthase
MTILEKIIQAKQSEVKMLHKRFTRESFSSSEFFNLMPLDFSAALNKKRRINLIAEIKKASPSKGVIRKDFDHLEIAKNYMKAGADAVSVLTDKLFFQGDISHLKDIAEIKIVPLLRKDFIIDEFQILEAKANGADAVLLIAEALSKKQVDELTSIAFDNRLQVLLEVHSPAQLEKINYDKNKIIGINNRDLTNFRVDINTTKEIAKLIPAGVTIVSESGFTTKGDLDFIKNTDTHAVLVGEFFMRNHDIEYSLTQFLDWCSFAN